MSNFKNPLRSDKKCGLTQRLITPLGLSSESESDEPSKPESLLGLMSNDKDEVTSQEPISSKNSVSDSKTQSGVVTRDIIKESATFDDCEELLPKKMNAPHLHEESQGLAKKPNAPGGLDPFEPTMEKQGLENTTFCHRMMGCTCFLA